MNSTLRKTLVDALSKACGADATVIDRSIERPKNLRFGDLALPCFELAKSAQAASPVQFAQELAKKLPIPAGFAEITPTGPFLNFKFDRPAYVSAVIAGALSESAPAVAPEVVLLEYSSPNIAKSFHVGHLRATLVGNSLDKLLRYLGYNIVSLNHLGDWGTQFGFVWAGCNLWGKPQSATVSELVELYRKATALKEQQDAGKVAADESALPDVNEMARSYFIDLERGEKYAVEFWQWCLDISMIYFKETYARLGVHFDHYIGESFYSDKLDGVIGELRKSGLLKESQGALGIDLGEELGFARVLTPDGRSLYLTRDIAAAEYRFKTFNFARAIYVVGVPQTLHFSQLKAVLRALGKSYADKIIHVPFGHVLGMKTRGEGGAIELHELLDEAYERALRAYREQVTKRPEGLDEQEVARHVARSAIVFANLNRARMKDVHFSWDQALAFQGDTGPYLLYAYARINGIKERAAASGVLLPATVTHPELLVDDLSYGLVSKLSEFEETLALAAHENEPCYLAMYALELAKLFSKAYIELKVVGTEQDLASSRLLLFEATKCVLKKALRLLGIEPLERM